MRITFALPIVLIAAAAATGCTPEESTSGSGDNNAPPLEPFAMAFDHKFASARIAAGPSGDVFVGGTFDGTFNFGGGDVVAPAPGALFFTHFDAEGDHIMSGSTGAYDKLGAVAVGEDGGCFGAGTFDGTVNFGVGKMTSEHAGFLTRFNGDGTTGFVRSFVNSYQTDIDSIAPLPGGGVVIAALTDDNVDFGNNHVGTGIGLADLVIAAYDKSGLFQWELRIPAKLRRRPWIAADKDGNVFLAAGTYGEFPIGNDLVAGDSAFVTKIDPTGSPLWTKQTEQAGDFSVAPDVDDISVDDEGNVYVVGSFYYAGFSIGGLTSSPGQSDHAYLFKLDGAGKGVYFHDFPIQSASSVCAVAGATNGEVLFGVTTDYPMNFGGGIVGTNDNKTGYLARFDANGKHMNSVALGNDRDDFIDDLAADKEGNPVIVGRFQNSIRLGGKTLFDKGVTASYVTRTKL